MAEIIDARPALATEPSQPAPGPRPVRRFVLPLDHGQGIQLDRLRPMSRLTIRTMNSRYRIVVLEPGWVDVQGGEHFLVPTEALFRGANVDDGSVDPSCVLVGHRMELLAPIGRVVTTRVQSIEVDLDSLHGPF